MSQRPSGYARQPEYSTPAWVTQALIPHLPKGIDTVWECAAGTGQMVSALKAAGFQVYGSDLQDGIDFLAAPALPEPDIDAIITNPPFELATEFIERALRMTEPNAGTVAMLLRTDFEHAKSRTHLFRDNPTFRKKVVLLRRITWFDPGPDRVGKSPSFNHSWYVFDHRHEGPPTVGFAP